MSMKVFHITAESDLNIIPVVEKALPELSDDVAVVTTIQHKPQLSQVKQLLEKHQMLILIGWSFFMLLPTDLLAYVCGTLRVSVAKFLLGVAIGEGLVCGMYIFFGHYLLAYLNFVL